jgi:hypothetical protein
VVTYFVVLGFQMGKGGVLIADEPKEIHGGEARCIAAARRLAESRAGVVAFSRTGDPKMGDWDDAVVLFQAGVFPEDMLEMVG